MELIVRPREAHRRRCKFLLGPRLASLVDPGITRDSLKIEQCRRRRPGGEGAADALDQLIDQLPLPAIVANRYQDVLAANAIARALSPGFAPGENFLRWRLLAPAPRFLHRLGRGNRGRGEWVTRIDSWRYGRSPLKGLDRRALGSQRPVSRTLGTRRYRIRTGILHVRHPVAGDLYLRRTRLSVPDSDTQVFICHPEPGSDSAKALETLSFITQCGNLARWAYFAVLQRIRRHKQGIRHLLGLSDMSTYYYGSNSSSGLPPCAGASAK